MSEYEVVDVASAPALYAVASCSRADIGKTIMEVLPTVIGRGSGGAARMAGPPFVRYTHWSETGCTLEIGAPVQEAVPATEGYVMGTLGGCRAVRAVHVGPYHTLSETHMSLMAWIEAEGLKFAGPRWESYVTDPGNEPDSSKWQTEVYFPVA